MEQESIRKTYADAAARSECGGESPAGRLFPTDIQTFSTIREGNYAYVDKTGYIHKILQTGRRYVFLNRPRRFGKSLFISTLKSYFEGRRDLFRGLEIDSLETEWESHPVLHFDMSGGKHMDADKLSEYLADQLNDNEKEFALPLTDGSVNIRLKNLITNLYKKSGKTVVVLIDEYDAPLLDVAHEEEDLSKLRQVMRNFYSPLKACDPYLRFVFLTGVTKFSQLSIFSELNNIRNISMDERFAAICGITEEEMLSQMADGLERIADELQITKEEALGEVKSMYDGYHFTWPSPDIYNPYSLVNAFSDGKLNSYWFGSGTPTYLVEKLRKSNVAPNEIGNIEARASAFDVPIETTTDNIPLLYQSGYLTIKSFDAGLYTLDIPNKEVRSGLMESLLPLYAPAGQTRKALNFGTKFYSALGEGDLDKAMRLLKDYLLTIPQTDNTDSEGHYQSLLYVIFDLGGDTVRVDVELHTVNGRIDLAVETKNTIYVIELKMNRSAHEAMAQIERKNYAAKYAFDSRPVIKVGINFDKSLRTISDWAIED